MQKIKIYTDGACLNNPGVGGWACILMSVFSTIEGGIPLQSPMLGIRRISGYIDEKTTNNIMELTAIHEALKSLKYKNRETIIYSDSQYAIGILTKGWNIKKNKDLVNTIQNQISQFSNLTFEYIKAHSGHKWNEECDLISNEAIFKKEGIDNYLIQPVSENDLF